MTYPDRTTPTRPAGGRSRRTVSAASAVLALLSLSAATLPAGAEETNDTAEDVPWWDASRFQVHGFLSQAYAQTDGDQVLGIDDDGTHDYRTAALQLRYRMTEDDGFAVQLEHEALGDSSNAEPGEDLELDWIFYRHSLSDATELKAGKVPIPRGIFNEVLDVGTLLPFYRPPLTLYGESLFAAETVDGLVLSHAAFRDAPWTVEADAYYGGWSFTESQGEELGEVDAEDALGFQVWVRPPVPGLRVGLAGQSFLVSGAIRRPPGLQERWEIGVGSLEWLHPRIAVRAEGIVARTNDSEYVGTYGQVGIHLTPKLTLNLQVQRADLEIETPRSTMDVPLDRDRAVGLSYAFRSDVVAKLEVHDNEGFSRIEEPSASLAGPAPETVYGILSLSVSF